MTRPDAPSALLAALYAEDVREHGAVPPAGTPEYRALRERDRERRAHVEIALDALHAPGGASPDGPSPDDLFHAAWLFNHGETPADARRGHELAHEAAQRGHRRARWLAAAAFDRWCMYEGRPQKYGTQFVPDGRRFRLWDLDPATNDAERAAWDVPPLAEQLRRADALTCTESQPPLAEAPGWLRAALARWRSA